MYYCPQVKEKNMAKKKQVADKKNKGEWGERYCFPKIIQTQKIKFGDKDLNIPNNNNFITISKLTTADLQQSFSLKPNNTLVHETKGAGKPNSINFVKIINKKTLNEIISKIKKGEKGKRTFELPELKSIEKQLGVDNMKGGSSDQKSDIFLDIKYNSVKEVKVGFSIKSIVGNNPSLLNATGHTNFVYEIKGLTSKHKLVVNSIKTRFKYIDRIKKIKELGGGFNYTKITSGSFNENLSKIDSKLPKLISNMLLHYYIDRYERLSCNLFKLSNFGKVKSKDKIAIENFLIAILFGMFPSKIWDSKKKARGLIVVKGDGDLVCFYDKGKSVKAGKEYLFGHAYFETPSSKNAITSKKAGGQEMLQLYEEEGKLYINLPLQIRLKGD